MFFRFPHKKIALTYPVPPAPPTAVLVPWFRPTRHMRVFPHGWNVEAAAFSPAALAARWPQLEGLLERGVPSLTHAVIVLALSPDELLTETQRGRLWQTFRVPVFEQIVNEAGVLLGAECEAHDGLHIETPSLAFDPHSIDGKPCGCGRTTPRLKPAGMRVQAVAAYAR